MKSKLIHQPDDGERVFAVILETGDEVMSCLETFAAEAELSAASFKAIGAMSDAELAFFDWETKAYQLIPVREQVEVASLTGDIATDADGRPALHIHAVLGRSDGSAVAGHLQKGTVRPTLEVIITESPAHLRKRYDSDLGISLIDPRL